MRKDRLPLDLQSGDLAKRATEEVLRQMLGGGRPSPVPRPSRPGRERKSFTPD